MSSANAMQMNNGHGPCCCKCWRWTAFEGQAKYLITELQWPAEEIAAVWLLEDGCGGAGTSMAQLHETTLHNIISHFAYPHPRHPALMYGWGCAYDVPIPLEAD